jgi:hypothetical protein
VRSGSAFTFSNVSSVKRYGRLDAHSRHVGKARSVLADELGAETVLLILSGKALGFDKEVFYLNIVAFGKFH